MTVRGYDGKTSDPDCEAVSGIEAGFMLCHDCHCIIPVPEEGLSEITCPRCCADVHLRSPDSTTYTWALVLTSLILIFPANILPIMTVDYLGTAEASTIMDGIIFFFKEGSYGIGAVILTASVLVPLFKIVGIILILLSIQLRWKSWLRHKTIMFRFIEFIGKWSMLDIFVIALLTVLVNFGFFSTIQAAPAATYFCGVVISTMLAAIMFDTRFIWDA